MRNRKSLIVFILQICVGLGLLSQLHAQTNLASITGTITDKAGATISNCKVIVTSKATGASRSFFHKREWVLFGSFVALGGIHN